MNIIEIILYPAEQCWENPNNSVGKKVAWGIIAAITAPITVPVFVIGAIIVNLHGN